MAGMFKQPDTGPAERALAEEKARTERLMKQAEEERRMLGEKSAATSRARKRGGARSLLSEARVTPEQGVTTLGSSDVYQA